ncbi:MAG: hypothetical protein WCC01_09700 [Acidimicrobiia bacterium]
MEKRRGLPANDTPLRAGALVRRPIAALRHTTDAAMVNVGFESRVVITCERVTTNGGSSLSRCRLRMVVGIFEHGGIEPSFR